MSLSASPTLEVDKLSVEYRTRAGVHVRAVSDVSFTLREGEVLGIAGESGCGKSTLVSGCMGLYTPPLHHVSGDVRIASRSIVGMPVKEHRRHVLGTKISMIPQGALSSLNPTRRIGDLARDVFRSHEQQLDRKELDARLQERFERIGLNGKEILQSYPVDLAAGTRQRVVIGISTLLNPKVVIADEPTSALDVSTQKAVIRLLFDLMDQGIISSMLFITHELPLLRHVSSKVAVMYAGQFVEYGTTEQVLFDGRQPYTKALMGSMLSASQGHGSEGPVALEGAPPNLAHPTYGCRFAQRCPQARPNCHEREQSLREVAKRFVRCEYAE